MQQYEWLVLALPAPQSVALAKPIDKSIQRLATKAHMQGCWTVMASFTENLNLPLDAAFINDEIISLISRNNSKPKRMGLESWIIHTNLPSGFSLQEDLKIGFCSDWLNGGRVDDAWLSGYKLAPPD